MAGYLQRLLVRAGGVTLLTARSFAVMFRRPLEWQRWLAEMENIGVRSLGVAGITTLFTGMVMALQTAFSLPSLGVKYYIGAVVSKSLVRELGSMKVTEQIDALRSMGADPVKKLVAPKLLASLVMIPALTVLGDAIGVLGGLIVGVFQLNVTASFYMNDVISALNLEDVSSGIGKSFFFAVFIAMIGCYNGLNVRGGADGVGRATTDTVVQASILILISDFFLTKLFFLL